jgi:hypothetical protein
LGRRGRRGVRHECAGCHSKVTAKKTLEGALSSGAFGERLGGHLRLGRADVPVERRDSARLQISGGSGGSGGGEEPENDDDKEESGLCHGGFSPEQTGMVPVTFPPSERSLSRSRT